MLYRKMPKTGDQLSILGFGCMRLPGGQVNVNETEAIAQIRYAIDSGINYLDTAWPYHGGKSEVILGKALQGGYRERVKIADKLPHWLCSKPQDLDYYLNMQLERLNVKVIDYYLIHSLDAASWQKAKALGVIDFMNRAKKDGRIVNVGFSFHGAPEDFKKIIDDVNWDFCQIQLNILDQNFQAGISGLKYAASKNIGVIVMEPLRGGSLAGKLPQDVEKIYRSSNPQRSNAEWALRWVWNNPEVITVLSGMNHRDQIDENIRVAQTATAGSLSPSEVIAIENAASTFRKLMKVPCTGCNYCQPCPKNVNIPMCFHFYNNKHLFKQGFMSRMLYLMQLSSLQGRKPMLASQCVQCGICVKQCPQQINIPSEITKVNREFEGILKGLLLMLAGLLMYKGRRKKQAA